MSVELSKISHQEFHISNYFEEARTMTLEGHLNTYTKNDVNFSYRHSTFPANEMLIEATFNCQTGFPEKIQEDRRIASQGRQANQPLRNRSAGSIFKNPSDKLAAGYLIDQAGVKGTRQGGACISKKHANFIINLGEATAKDVYYLILLAKQKVAEKFNINLELEVKLVGFPKSMMNEKIITGGMIPKIKTCVETVGLGVKAAEIIDGRSPHAILREIFTTDGSGTMIDDHFGK